MKPCIKSLWIFFSITLISSCGGYKLQTRRNPFEQNNIRKVAIPTFVNRSMYAGAGPIFTREIMDLFSSFSDLKISPSTGVGEDAVLVGIVSSPTRYGVAHKTTSTRFTSGELKQSIGQRAQFYLPLSSTYLVTVRILLIKNPTTAQRELLASGLGEKLINHPKVVFNKSFIYEGAFNRETKDTVTSDSGGLVNYTKTKRYFNQSLEGLAKQTAIDLEGLVINVF